MLDKTPKELGYHFPAEFAKHDGTWLSWPHKEASWPGKIKKIYPVYAKFIKLLAEGEQVNINVTNDAMRKNALSYLVAASADLNRIKFFIHPTNDAWCRDHGPAFLFNP
jgi:agmatine deiminase